MTTDVNGGYYVGWMPAGEWLKYTVNVVAGAAPVFVTNTGSEPVPVAAQGATTIAGSVTVTNTPTVNAAQSFSGTVLSGGTANISATAGSISGTVVGIGGVSASGGGGITASLLGQNVSVAGATGQSTLGTSATATTASQAAAQQANSEAQQQVASNDPQEDDQKKKDKRPVLTRRVGRVTVVLPPKS